MERQIWRGFGLFFVAFCLSGMVKMNLWKRLIRPPDLLSGSINFSRRATLAVQRQFVDVCGDIVLTLKSSKSTENGGCGVMLWWTRGSVSAASMIDDLVFPIL